MKKLAIVVLILTVSVLLLVFLQFLLSVPHYNKLTQNKETLQTCSWLKVIPKNLQCSDNWNNRLRRVIAQNTEQTLELTIGYHPLQEAGCLNVFPANFPRRPSASCLAIPFWCIQDRKIFLRADWEQDGWHFHLKGHNIPLSLFLFNLDNVGWSQLSEQMSLKI